MDEAIVRIFVDMEKSDNIKTTTLLFYKLYNYFEAFWSCVCVPSVDSLIIPVWKGPEMAKMTPTFSRPRHRTFLLLSFSHSFGCRDYRRVGRVPGQKIG